MTSEQDAPRCDVIGCALGAHQQPAARHKAITRIGDRLRFGVIPASPRRSPDPRRQKHERDRARAAPFPSRGRDSEASGSVTAAWHGRPPCWPRAGVCSRHGAQGESKRPAVSTAAAAWRGETTVSLNARSCTIGLAASVDFCTAGRISWCHAHDETVGASPKRGLAGLRLHVARPRDDGRGLLARLCGDWQTSRRAARPVPF